MLFLIILFLWLSSALPDYSAFCYFWQLKEYRWDRFKDFLSTTNGKKFLLSYSVCSRPIICIIIFLLITDIKLLYPALILMLTVDLARNAIKFKQRQLKRPKITLKSIGIIFISLFFETCLFFLLINSNFVFLLLACRWFILSGIVIIAKLPTILIKIIYLKKAKNKLLQQKNLLVIGVTGSYGKTTVKNFLEQILIVKYRVIKTPANINTEIGIAKFILKTDFSKIDIFIVEMGAYKRGEIKTICKLVKPKIGILTAINEQHLSLFGSLENIQLAKYELLDSLPSDSLAITNSDNEYCRQYLPNAVSQVKTFGENRKFNPDCLVKNKDTECPTGHSVSKPPINNQGINFSVEIKENEKTRELKISAPIIGEHNRLNIAPAILVGLFLDIKDEYIIKQCAKLKLPFKTLQIYNFGKSLIIDDSYNANPQGFLSALKILNEYQGDWKKIVITRGMLELGKKSEYWHEKIGQTIAQVANELIIISPDSVKPLKKGVGNNKNISVKVEFNSDKLLADFQQFKNEKCLILIENRLKIPIY